MEKKKYEKYRLGSLSECLEERAVLLAQYMIEHKATVRQTAAVFGVSKSTVHKDVTVTLEKVDRTLHEKVCLLLDVNKRERHIRGGEATRKKYADIKIRSAHLGEAISGRTSDDRNCLSKT
mgnify:CR=1 FL=1